MRLRWAVLVLFLALAVGCDKASKQEHAEAPEVADTSATPTSEIDVAISPDTTLEVP